MGVPTQAQARALLAKIAPRYYLLENRERIRNPDAGQFNDRRRPRPWDGVRGPIPQGTLHSYEAPITRSLIACAEYIVTRASPGGYHGLAGDDSPTDIMPLAPVTAETWHCVPSNPWAIGWSAVMQAHTWRTIPALSRDNIVKSLAFGFYLSSLELIVLGLPPIPARVITKTQAMRGGHGFVMHRHMDEGRRSDIANPESDFPWAAFLAEYTRLIEGAAPAGPTITPQEDPDMRDVLFKTKGADGKDHHYGTLGPDSFTWVEDEAAYLKTRKELGREVKWWENIANDRTVADTTYLGTYVGPEAVRPVGAR